MDAPPSLTERFAVLRAMQAMQYQRVCEMEDELAEARRELADTSRRMNQMAAEINKSTDCG